MAQEGMPPGFPRSSDFPADQVREYKISWRYHRDHNQGGANYGTDFIAPNDAVVVDFDVHITSDHNTKGDADIHLVMKSLNVVQMPVGVHVGHRLEPILFVAGATYQGEITMKMVSPQAWIAKALSNIGH